MHDTCTVNPYLHIDFWECDACNTLLASLGLAQIHPNCNRETRMPNNAHTILLSKRYICMHTTQIPCTVKCI